MTTSTRDIVLACAAADRAALRDGKPRPGLPAGLDLSFANLRDANLRDANLRDANLRFADLRDATMPDGRTWEAYRADHMTGLCDDPEVRARAIAAWGKHSWQDCPMHAAHGWRSAADAGDRAAACALWVALYDSGQLPRPEGGAS